MLGLRGITHISFSVRDLERSAAWYEETLGLRTLVRPFAGREYRETILSIPGGIGLCLQEHASNDGAEFSETCTGLDHLALGVPDRVDLIRWADRLKGLAVAYTWQTESDRFGSMLVFRDPDGIQLELHSLPRNGGDEGTVTAGERD